MPRNRLQIIFISECYSRTLYWPTVQCTLLAVTQIMLDNFRSIVDCKVQRNLKSCKRKLHCIPRLVFNKSTAVANMGDRGYKRHGPKRGGCSAHRLVNIKVPIIDDNLSPLLFKYSVLLAILLERSIGKVSPILFSA